MNTINIRLLFGTSLALLLHTAAFGKEYPGKPERKDIANKVDAANCAPATSSIDLNINNVRARIMNGGDMWWDLVGSPKYEVPKDPGPGVTVANSLFAGAVWIGGIDQNNQLKVAAQTYRQTGNDFFPGPLDGAGGTTTKEVCDIFDKQWQVFGSEIDDVIQQWESANPGGSSGTPLAAAGIPQNVLNWPGKNNPYVPDVTANRNLAPFFDRDGDGNYDPTAGDYPILGVCDNSNVYADQMIWWVYNDNGNIHSETGGEPIGMEVQALAFAYIQKDLADMTFYNYKLINKSSNTLNDCYMGQWVDPDLGCYTDDYIGCDVENGLGIVYNQDADDAPCGAGGGYGKTPPLVGIDYFQGPLDENGNELGMSNFLYFNNDFTTTGNPENTSDFYGYLSGKWKDGTPFTEGGTAYGGTEPTHYVFPDPPNQQGGWSECSSGTQAADRRIVESSGPFKLLPGASNKITIGAVWVRPPAGTYPCPSYDLLINSDKKAQALFDNCFKLLQGPPAFGGSTGGTSGASAGVVEKGNGGVRVIELDRKLILSIEGYQKTETYQEADPQAKALGIPDSLYRFEGYQIYQVRSKGVTSTDLSDPAKARLIYQVDVKNGVTTLINYEYDASVGTEVPVLKVTGADEGIKHTFEVTVDQFATGDPRLVNFQTYFFAVLPYAYNGYSRLDTVGTIVDTSGTVYYQTQLTQQPTPYLEGKLVADRNVVSGIPHVPMPEFNGITLNADYGDGPMITRQEGTGNGGLSVRLTDESVQAILDNTFAPTITYKPGAGPVQVKVFDPKNVPAAEFELVLRDSTLFSHWKTYYVKDTVIDGASQVVFTNANDPDARDTSLWVLKEPSVTNPLTVLTDTAYWVLRIVGSDSAVSERTIAAGVEQVIPDWGLSIYVQQVKNPAIYTSDRIVIDADVEFEEPFVQWLGGIEDLDGDPQLNWILSGTYGTDDPQLNQQSDYNDGEEPAQFEDPTQQFEDLGRTIAPYRFVSLDKTYGPGWTNALARTQNSLSDLPSIDLVFTPDKSKWTRCVVIETQPMVSLSEGNVLKMAVRNAPGVNKDGVVSTDPNDHGMGWFPGYAINPETGTRLNIMFGEDSWLQNENGRDMMWNPSSNISTENGEVVLGGRHFIYVMKTKYDSCKDIKSKLTVAAGSTLYPVQNFIAVYKTVGWVAQPLLAEGYQYKSIAEGLIPTETAVRIRVTRAYEKLQAGDPVNRTLPRYTFSTADLAPRKNELEVAKNALDTIKVVPNPYYAYSNYESGPLENRVKVTNLPKKCTVSIFSLDGTLIRRIERDDDSNTFLDWDLKNTAGIQIASGVYIVHIDAGELGEKTLKWFGVMRPIDLDSF